MTHTAACVAEQRSRADSRGWGEAMEAVRSLLDRWRTRNLLSARGDEEGACPE
jgi:hypothetical protein